MFQRMSILIKKLKRLRESNLQEQENRSQMEDMHYLGMMMTMMDLEWDWKWTQKMKMRTKMRMKMRKAMKVKKIKIMLIMMSKIWMNKKIWMILNNKLSILLQKMVKQNNRSIMMQSWS